MRKCINTSERLKRLLWKDKILITVKGCWEWQGSRYNTGYGEIWRYGKRQLAHRVSYQLAFGELLLGEIVMHRCDNPPCVNPLHLKEGTQANNLNDMKKKGRASRIAKALGEKNGNSKLTGENVDTIRKIYAMKKYTQQQIAEMFNCHHSLISLIIRNKIWRI